jgi:hypothetical protein
VRVIGNTIYIPGIDAKDLYISNLNDKEYGYSLINKNGEANYRKYVNALDYSLDQIKLREVYEKIDKLERTKLNVKEFSKREEEYVVFAVIAFAALFLEILLRNTILRRIP